MMSAANSPACRLTCPAKKVVAVWPEFLFLGCLSFAAVFEAEGGGWGACSKPHSQGS
jgi:hypothetical protein